MYVGDACLWYSKQIQELIFDTDGTQNYRYLKTVITSDYHSHDGPWGFVVVSWIYFYEGNGHKNQGVFYDLFLWGKTARNQGSRLTYNTNQAASD
jgi:hypothetical protein